MTQKRILQLAYNGILEIWSRERAFLEQHPEDAISKGKESRYWEELKEIEKLRATEA